MPPPSRSRSDSAELLDRPDATTRVYVVWLLGSDMKDGLPALGGLRAHGLIHRCVYERYDVAILASEVETLAFSPQAGSPMTHQTKGPVGLPVRLYQQKVKRTADASVAGIVSLAATIAGARPGNLGHRHRLF